jgi:hypothetical protein
MNNEQLKLTIEEYEAMLTGCAKWLSSRPAGQTANEYGCQIYQMLGEWGDWEWVEDSVEALKPDLYEINKKLDYLVSRNQPKKVAGMPKARHEYSPWFEEVWKLYPPRSGGNNKFDAEKQWKARVISRSDNIEKTLTKIHMLDGTRRYAAFCKATDVDPRYVMQAQRFFGKSQHYLEDWDIPAPEQQKPKTQEEKLAWAKAQGFTAKPGESYVELFHRAGVPH